VVLNPDRGYRAINTVYIHSARCGSRQGTAARPTPRVERYALKNQGHEDSMTDHIKKKVHRTFQYVLSTEKAKVLMSLSISLLRPVSTVRRRMRC
jgi:hypothetical protein